MLKHFNLIIATITLLIFTGIMLLTGCSNPEQTQKAIKYSIDDIQNNPDFYWYQMEYNLYNFNPHIIDSIANRFDKNELKIIVFTSPSCFCGSIYAKFPQIIKVLDSANIPANNYEIYVTKDTGYKLKFDHPYANLFEVKTLPSIYLLKFDSLYYDLLLQVNTKKISIEEALLEGLKFFEY
jgi:hypothetical protein